MTETVDVVEVKVSDAKRGDLLVTIHGDVVGTVARIDDVHIWLDLDDRRDDRPFSLELSRLNVGRSTLPITSTLRAFTGVRGTVLELVRPV